MFSIFGILIAVYRVVRTLYKVSPLMVIGLAAWIFRLYSDPIKVEVEKIVYRDLDIPKLSFMDFEFHELKQLLVTELIRITVVLFVLKVMVKKFLKPHKVLDSGTVFEPERYVEGSEFLPESCPPFQAKIFGREDGELYRCGQSFRVDDFLITAKHVIDEYQEIVAFTNHGSLTIPASRFSCKEGDLAVVRLSQQEIGQIGIKSARLTDSLITETTGLFCRADGFAQGSIGMVLSHPAFGFCKYRGSTTKGFSGAPYYNCDRVYGMHLGGCAENMGYSAAYIRMLLRTYREDTVDFLFSQLNKQKDYVLDYQQSPFDPDEYRVRLGNSYYLVTSDDITRLEARRSGKVTYDSESVQKAENKQQPIPTAKPERHSEPQEPEVSLDDLLLSVETILKALETESISREEQPSENCQAPEQSVPVTGAPGQLEEVSSAAPKARVPPRPATISSTRKPSNSNGPPQTRVQRNVVFQDISTCLSNLRKIRSLCPTQFSNKQLKQPQQLSEFGKFQMWVDQLKEVSSKSGLKLASKTLQTTAQ